MGIRRQKNEEIAELNIDFSFKYNPIILTNEFLSQTLSGCEYNKSTILLPAQHIQVLELSKFKISQESDYSLDNGFSEETLLREDYIATLLREFQEKKYLEFAIATQFGIEHYSPNEKVKNLYQQNSQSKKPQILALGEEIIKSTTELFEIKQIKTQKELSHFQTANHPRKQYFSIGSLVQLNNTLKSLTQEEITNMALQFIDKKLKYKENLELKLGLKIVN